MILLVRISGMVVFIEQPSCLGESGTKAPGHFHGHVLLYRCLCYRHLENSYMCSPRWVRQAGFAQLQSCPLPLTQEVGIFLSSCVCELVDLNVSITFTSRGRCMSVSCMRTWQPGHVPSRLQSTVACSGLSVRDPGTLALVSHCPGYW